jgi:hypothetical protein
MDDLKVFRGFESKRLVTTVRNFREAKEARKRMAVMTTAASRIPPCFRMGRPGRRLSSG